MSRVIDERILQMRFDNAQFERGISQTMSSVQNLKNSLDMNGTAKGLSVMDRAIGTVQARFSALEVVGVTALANIANSAVNAGKQLVKSLTIDPIKTGFQEYETQINAVQTILANTSSKGTTLDQVNAALDELNHYADMTIYNFTEMTRNIGTFTAAGVDLNTSVSAIKGIANLAAVSGSTSQQASTAMYQLSQALAAGTVKLQDWNSVVNAVMGGQVFQDALMETARIHGVAIDQMVKDEGSFRETLKNGWLTSSVLTETLAKFTGDLSEAELKAIGYTNEQIQSIMQMGQTANDAATKVKTFTQLFDTLKEAAQSGWTQTWELLIGDFEEAKELLTGISDAASEMINVSADARNEMIAGAMTSGWSQFLNEGITDAVGFKEAIVDAAREHGVAIEGIIANSKTFEDSLSQGWLTADVLSDALQNLTAKTAGLSDEELASIGYTREQADALATLNQSIKDGSIDIEEYINKIGRLSGRENIIQGFWNIWDGLFAVPEEAGDLIGVFTAIQNAFRDIFPKTTSEQLYQLTENFKNFTEKFKMSGETAENLKNTFKGFFAVLDIGKQAASSAWKALSPLLGVFGDLGGGLLSMTGGIGQWLAGVDELIRENDIFGSSIQAVIHFLKDVKEALHFPDTESIKAALQSFKDSLPGLDGFNGILERVYERFDQIADSASNLRSGVLGVFEKIGNALSRCAFVTTLQGIWDLVKTIGSGAADVLGNLIEKISNVNFNGVVDILNGLSLGGIFAGIIKFLGIFDKAVGSAGAIKDSVVGVLDSVKDCFSAYQEQLKAGTLIKIASAIAILTGSLVALSLIDSERLASALVAVTGLFADLMGSMAIMTKISGNMKGISKVVAPMLAMSTALLILASAMKKVADLEWEDLAQGLTGITGLSVVLVGSMKLLSMGGGKLAKGASGLVLFAAAIKVLASACKDLSGLDWNQMAVGLTGIGVIMAETAAFTLAAGNAKHIVSTGLALIEIAAAMKIFASAVSAFGSMNPGQSAQGILAMGAALTEVAVAVNFMPKNMVSIGTGLIAVGAALEILANAFGKFGNFTPEQIVKGLIAMGGALAELALGLNVMNGTLSGSAAMMVAAGALAVLTPVLMALGSMSWEAIAKGLISIAGAFTVIGIAGAVLTPLVPSILSLSGALALIGAGTLGIGAGLLAAGTGLAALATGFTALVAAVAGGATGIVAGLSVIITGLAAMIPAVIVKIGEGLIAICDVVAHGAPSIGEAFKAIVLTLVDVLVECGPSIADGALYLVNELLAALVRYTPQIVDNLMTFLIEVLNGVAARLPELIQAGVNVLDGFFSGLADALGNMDAGELLKGSIALAIMTAVMHGLAGVVSVTPMAMAGVVAMGAVIAELALVLAAVGALAQIPGLNWLVEEGGGLLENIGAALGGFVGGIVGGFMGGVTGQLPDIATDLSAFMTNLQPFISIASQIDSSALQGVESLADVILTLTAADLLQGITSWITGGSSIATFGEELVSFGAGLKAYSDSIGGMNVEAVKASATAAEALSNMANSLSKSGGIVGLITGEQNLGAFGKEMVDFGSSLKDYSDKVSGLKVEAVTSSVSAAESLISISEDLSRSGGLAGLIAGNRDLAAFGEDMVTFGSSLKSYSDSVSNLKADKVIDSASAAKALVEISNSLSNTGGLKGFLVGNQNLSALGTQLVSLGQSVQSYSDSVVNIDKAALAAATGALRDLLNLNKEIGNGGSMGLTKFVSSLGDMGTKAVDGFISAFTDANKRALDAGKALSASLEKGMKTGVTSFAKVGQDAAQGLINGIRSKLGAASSAGASLGQAVVSGTRKALDSHSPSEEERKAGVDAGKGLVAGAQSMVSKAKTAGSNLGKAVAGGTNQALDSINVDAWIGKVNKAGAAEVQVAEKTAAADKKSSDTKVKSAKKVSKAKKEASKSSFEVFKEYIEEEEFYGRLDTAEKLEQYKKVLDAYKLSAEERKEVCREIYTLEKQLRDESYQHSMDWIEKEKYFNRLSLEEELAAYERVQARYKQGTDEWLKMEKEKYRVKQELEDASYQHSMDWISQEESYDRLGLAAKLAAYTRVQQRYEKGTDRRKELDKQVYGLQKQIWQAEKDYYADVEKANKEYNEKRASLEQEYADKVKSVNSKLEQDIKSVNDRLAQDIESVNSQLAKDIENVNKQLQQDIQSLNNQLEQDIKSLNEQYESSLESRINSLYKAYGLFDEVTEKEDVSGDVLMKNLEDQVQEFENWQDTLDALSSRGLSSELIAELQEMGPSSIAQIKALNNLSDEELEKYASLWGIKHALARERATDELKGLREDTDKQIAGLRTDAEKQLAELHQNANTEITNLRQDAASEIAGLRQDAASEIEGMRRDAEEELAEYRAEWEKQMSELESTTAKQLEELKKTFEQTVGLLPEYTEAEFSEMVTSANNILRQAGWTELGQQIVDGLTSGVMNHQQKFVSSLTDLANAGVEAVKTTLDIHSPSRVFEKLGNFAAMGFVDALSNYRGRSYEAGLSLADNARKGLSFASEAIADVLENDTEPIIRPVLDLTDVETKAGRLDSLFTREQRLLIQNVDRRSKYDSVDALGGLLRDSLSAGNDDIVDAIGGLRSDVATLSDSMRRMQVVLDSGTMVGELTPAIDQELGNLANWRGRNM